MKFMINGAITFGTMDGANVEIHDAVGDKNVFIFGMNAQQVDEAWIKGYNSTLYYNNNPIIHDVIDRLKVGFAGKSFMNIVNYLLTDRGIADQYMCLADFSSYLNEYKKLDAAYNQKRLWNQMSVVNISESGRFAADRAIEEYATRI